LNFDRKLQLGQGGYGNVFRGTFNGEEVAVKRVGLWISSDNRELEINQKLSRLNHPNIVQLKHYEEDDDFR
jgi:serine/threonine protein kinase